MYICGSLCTRLHGVLDRAHIRILLEVCRNLVLFGSLGLSRDQTRKEPQTKQQSRNWIKVRPVHRGNILGHFYSNNENWRHQSWDMLFCRVQRYMGALGISKGRGTTVGGVLGSWVTKYMVLPKKKGKKKVRWLHRTLAVLQVDTCVWTVTFISYEIWKPHSRVFSSRSHAESEEAWWRHGHERRLLYPWATLLLRAALSLCFLFTPAPLTLFCPCSFFRVRSFELLL